MHFETIEAAVVSFKGDRNQVAFKHIYNSISKKIYYTCLRYMKTEDESKDAMQDIFIQVYQKIESYKNAGSFEGWVKKIAINYCLQKIRNAKSVIFYTEEIENYDGNADENFDELQLNNLEVNLLEIMKTLPYNYQIILNMTIVDDYAHKEIAKYLGIEENTSRIQLMRAKTLLKNKLIQNGKG